MTPPEPPDEEIAFGDRIDRHIEINREQILLTLTVAGVALTSNWCAAELKDHFDSACRDKAGPVGWGWSILFTAMFAGAVYCAYLLRETWSKPRTRELKADTSPPPRGHLVLFLSELRVTKDTDSHGVPNGITLGNDLTSDIMHLEERKRVKGIRWPWEMPLRGVAHNLGTLACIYLIASEESAKQVVWFLQLLGRYSNSQLQGVSIEVLTCHGRLAKLIDARRTTDADNGWDYEDFDQLTSALRQLLATLKQRGVRPDDIVIDITSGQKPTSVVAAANTFNQDVKAKYVQTNDPWKVVGYDLVFSSQDTRGLG